MKSTIPPSLTVGLGVVAVCSLGATIFDLPATVGLSRPSRVVKLQRAVVGSMAPNFMLTDCKGHKYQLLDFRGTKVLLCFFCGCDQCREMARGLAELVDRSRGIQLLAVGEFDRAAADEFIRETSICFPLLLDPLGKVADLYQSATCPQCWLL